MSPSFNRRSTLKLTKVFRNVSLIYPCDPHVSCPKHALLRVAVALPRKPFCRTAVRWEHAVALCKMGLHDLFRFPSIYYASTGRAVPPLWR